MNGSQSIVNGPIGIGACSRFRRSDIPNWLGERVDHVTFGPFHTKGLGHFLDNDLEEALGLKIHCAVRVNVVPENESELRDMVFELQNSGARLSLARRIDMFEVDIQNIPFENIEKVMVWVEHVPCPMALKIPEEFGKQEIESCAQLCTENDVAEIVTACQSRENAERQITWLRECIRKIRHPREKPMIVGGDGIRSADDIRAYLAAGADMCVQVVEAFILGRIIELRKDLGLEPA